MNRILVTGSGGFIGRALVEFLQSYSYDVVAIGSKDGDIACRETLAGLEKNDFIRVYHLAGKTFVPDSWNDSLSFYKTNVLGSANVLEYCKSHGVPLTFISAYVYGDPISLPITENSQVLPNNPYALSKYMAEEACKFYSSVYNLPVMTIRPFNVYGIGQNSNFLIPSIINQVLNEKVVKVSDLVPRRDYVYLKDLLSALLVTLDIKKGYHVYNVGSGYSLSVKEVIDIIQGIAGTKKEIISGNSFEWSTVIWIGFFRNWHLNNKSSIE